MMWNKIKDSALKNKWIILFYAALLSSAIFTILKIPMESQLESTKGISITWLLFSGLFAIILLKIFWSRIKNQNLRTLIGLCGGITILLFFVSICDSILTNMDAFIKDFEVTIKEIKKVLAIVWKLWAAAGIFLILDMRDMKDGD